MFKTIALGPYDDILVETGIEAAPHNGATNTTYPVKITCLSGGLAVSECFYSLWLVDALTGMALSGEVIGVTDLDGNARVTLTTGEVVGDCNLYAKSGRKTVVTPITISSLGSDDTLTVSPPAEEAFDALEKSSTYLVTIVADSGDPLEDAYYEASLVDAPDGTELTGDTSGLTDDSGEASFTIATGATAGEFDLVVRSGLNTVTTACEVLAGT